jgi:hypothetical protein
LTAVNPGAAMSWRRAGERPSWGVLSGVGGGRVSVPGEGRERVQPGVDELGGAADVGGHCPVDLLGRAGAAEVFRQRLELDAP